MIVSAIFYIYVNISSPYIANNLLVRLYVLTKCILNRLFLFYITSILYTVLMLRFQEGRRGVDGDDDVSERSGREGRCSGRGGTKDDK